MWYEVNIKFLLFEYIFLLWKDLFCLILVDFVGFELVVLLESWFSFWVRWGDVLGNRGFCLFNNGELGVFWDLKICVFGGGR